jgi:hypothetical protein
VDFTKRSSLSYFTFIFQCEVRRLTVLGMEIYDFRDLLCKQLTKFTIELLIECILRCVSLLFFYVFVQKDEFPETPPPAFTPQVFKDFELPPVPTLTVIEQPPLPTAAPPSLPKMMTFIEPVRCFHKRFSSLM